MCCDRGSSFEPYTSNLYVRRTLAGEFVCVSRHLLSDLIARGIWTPALKNKLISHNGSVQRIDEVPADLKALYKTVWEISQRHIIKMAAERGAYIDQSQSLNIHINDPTYGKLSSMHFYGWEMGLKTGMYYLRSKPAVDAIKFTVDQGMLRTEDSKKASEDAAIATKNAAAPAVATKDLAVIVGTATRSSLTRLDDLFSAGVASPIAPLAALVSIRPTILTDGHSALLHTPTDGKGLSTLTDDNLLAESALLRQTSSLASTASSSPPLTPTPRIFSAELAATSKSAASTKRPDGVEVIRLAAPAALGDRKEANEEEREEKEGKDPAPFLAPSTPSVAAHTEGALAVAAASAATTPSVDTEGALPAAAHAATTTQEEEELTRWRAEREKAKKKLMCSIANREACVNCSG